MQRLAPVPREFGRLLDQTCLREDP